MPISCTALEAQCHVSVNNQSQEMCFVQRASPQWWSKHCCKIWRRDWGIKQNFQYCESRRFSRAITCHLSFVSHCRQVYDEIRKNPHICKASMQRPSIIYNEKIDTKLQENKDEQREIIQRKKNIKTTHSERKRCCKCYHLKIVFHLSHVSKKKEVSLFCEQVR